MEPKIQEKSWNPELESKVLEGWRGSGIYDFKPGRGKAYTIDTPPPYPSGRPWHVGAAAHYSQIDMIARTARMSGRNVYFPIGIDRNGLPVETYTEKKHGIRMRETDRGEFIDLCKDALDDLESEMIEIMTILGISGEIDGRYKTDSDEYRTLTQSTFIDLWNRGLIYLSTRPNNYDWVSGTTIADAEITYEEIATKLVHMRFEMADSDRHIIIASTRPELLCACRAVIVNGEDRRYAGLVGCRVRVPIFGHEVEIMEHHSARPEFGSGAVMICSYGDQNDVALFRELRLDPVQSVGLDGRMTAAAGAYTGLRPKQARERITRDLEEAGLVEKIEEISHRTPLSERTKTPIEIVPMEEYYLKQMESIEKVRNMGREIKFHPPMHQQILMNWLDSISIDWPISRRRYYGTEIPIWYCVKCAKPYVPESGKYYRPWKERCPAESCDQCGCAEFTGEERTLDTWMDSSVSPLFISRYNKNEEFFDDTYPASIRPQAKDIVRTWLYYTLLRCEQMTGKRPWSEAWIMGYGLDERGLKMSKSKGNSIDPLPVIRRLGADAFRFWSACEVTQGYDFRCNEQKIASTQKFLSKLWNISRFISSFPRVEGRATIVTDRWMLSELNRLVKECGHGYAEYNFFIPGIAIREFTWNLFAAHYIEMVKARAYGDGSDDAGRDSAIFTLHKVLSTILRLLAPIAPFITEHLWKTLYSEGSIHAERLPEQEPVEDMEHLTKQITEFNSEVWTAKKSGGLSLKDSVDVPVPDSLAEFASDLRSMHNLD